MYPKLSEIFINSLFCLLIIWITGVHYQASMVWGLKQYLMWKNLKQARWGGWHKLSIPAFQNLKREDCEFQTSGCDIVRAYLKKGKQNTKLKHLVYLLSLLFKTRSCCDSHTAHELLVIPLALANKCWSFRSSHRASPVLFVR